MWSKPGTTSSCWVSPQKIWDTHKISEREKSHNFILRAKTSSNCGICLQISSSEGFRLKQFTLLLHGIDHNLHLFAKGIKGIIPTPIWTWQPCSHHSQIPQRSGFRASAQVDNSLSIIISPLDPNNHTWMHSPKSGCTAGVVLDPRHFSLDVESTILFPFPTLQEELWASQYLNYSHKTWEAKVWLLSYQRFLFWPGTREKHPVSQRNGGNLIKLRRAKLRS